MVIHSLLTILAVLGAGVDLLQHLIPNNLRAGVVQHAHSQAHSYNIDLEAQVQAIDVLVCGEANSRLPVLSLSSAILLTVVYQPETHVLFSARFETDDARVAASWPGRRWVGDTMVHEARRLHPLIFGGRIHEIGVRLLDPGAARITVHLHEDRLQNEPRPTLFVPVGVESFAVTLQGRTGDRAEAFRLPKARNLHLSLISQSDAVFEVTASKEVSGVPTPQTLSKQVTGGDPLLFEASVERVVVRFQQDGEAVVRVAPAGH